MTTKLLIAAAAASLVAGGALAGTDLDAATGTGGTYASEAVLGTPTQNLAVGAAADQVATAAFGASFATDAVAYVRFDLSAGTFTANPTFAINDSAPAAATVSVAQGGAGQSYVIFAVAPTAGNNLVGSNTGTFTGAGVTVSDKNGALMTYKLFETLTNAANNTLPLKTVSGVSWISFAPAVTITAGSAQSAVADVSATNGAYTAFTGPATEKAIGAFTVSHTARATLAGAATTIATVLTNTNGVTVAGDFSARLTATTGVTINNASNCAGGINLLAATIDDTTATFTNITANGFLLGNPYYICYEVNGTTAIPEATYSGTIDLVGQAGYSPTDGATGTGSITRNGTVLKAAFAEGTTVNGQSTAVSLTNNGSIAAPFTTSCLTTAGRVAGNGGTVAAGNGARFGVNSAGGLNCPASTRGVELTFSVPAGTVIGSVVRQSTDAGTASYDRMVGNQ